MPEMNARQKRFVARRRKAAVERALKYLSDGLAGCPDARIGTAERQVRESPRPLMVAKALVKDWCQRHRSLAPTPTPTPRPRDERAALIRAACAMELGHAWPAGHGIELMNE